MINAFRINRLAVVLVAVILLAWIIVRQVIDAGTAFESLGAETRLYDLSKNEERKTIEQKLNLKFPSDMRESKCIYLGGVNYIVYIRFKSSASSTLKMFDEPNWSKRNNYLLDEDPHGVDWFDPALEGEFLSFSRPSKRGMLFVTVSPQNDHYTVYIRFNSI